MSERITIDMGGDEIELTPKNTAIVRYMSHHAIHNHIRLSIDEDNYNPYVFRECKGFEALNAVLEDNEFPMVVHAPEASEAVIQAHTDMILEYAEEDGEDIEVEVEKWRRVFEN